MINDTYSSSTELHYGVPQGSVLGPLFFNIYIRPVYSVIKKDRFDADGFADDQQLLKHFYPVFQTTVLGHEIGKCLHTVNQWMSERFLKLNKSKTKILVAGPPDVLDAIEIHGTFLDSECIRFVSSAKNLGIWMDEHMSFRTHVNKTVSSCFFTIKEISKIKGFIPRNQLNAVVVPLITLKLDYCNSLLYNINSAEIQKLQMVQNAAIRLVCSRNKFDRLPLTPLYDNLHWLRVKERIVFKICLIVQKCIWGVSAEALKELFTVHNSRTFRLEEKRCNGRYGERAISHSGPKLWNALPFNMRCESNTDIFKKKLKTFLMSTNLHNFYLSL